MVKGPKGGLDIFKKRQKKLLEKIGDGVGVIFAHPEQIRNNDVHHKYRQDSTFYYLTGFSEPESVIVFDASSPSPFTMFVRQKDATRELWDGFRYGIDGAAEYFGANKVYPIDDLVKILPELLKNTSKVYYKLGEQKEHDEIIMTAIDHARRSRGRSGLGQPNIIDLKQITGEMRLIKQPEEIELLRKACEISAYGHIAAMRACKPGVNEYEIEAEVEHEFRRRGSDRLGYNSIVGSGPNATVLHYVFNDDVCKREHLLLIDAGAEFGYFTGDITRTFPVGGTFSPAQKKFYDVVLKVQKDCIEFVKPGVKLADIHQRAIKGLIDGMLSLGLMKGSAKDIYEKKEYIKYYPHGTGHWLGMDVHDSGLYSIDGEPRALEPGMCFTIEPGLYVPENDKDAPAEFRGMGVRIEDDILVTSKGCEVLTKLAPKETHEIEAILGKSV
ncbi:MAG: aminopeptidase P N-terminal domain-containing protein [Oligoflexia bacterium]|nr:aminopeptidase P N-terminal domain-containing protein [Oligoflexia bacterium]